MHFAGWFGDFEIDPNVDRTFYETMPILIYIVGVQVVLYWAAFFSAAKAKRGAHVGRASAATREVPAT